MTDLLWFVLEVIVRVILTLVGIAAGLVALAITAGVALFLRFWRETKWELNEFDIEHERTNKQIWQCMNNWKPRLLKRESK